MNTLRVKLFSRDYISVCVAALISVLLVCTSILYFWHKQEVEHADWIDRAREKNRLVAHDLGQIMSGVQQVIVSLTRDLQERFLEPNSELATYAHSREFHDKMHYAAASYRSSLRMSFVDNAGTLAAISSHYPAPFISVLDRQYFIACRDQDPATMHITALFKTLLDGTHVFLLCTPVVGKSGTRLGVLVAVLARSLIDDVFALGDTSRVHNHVLVLRDGTIITTATPQADRRGGGDNIANAVFLLRYDEARRGLLTSAQSTSKSLQTERIVTASEPIAGLPLILGGAVTEATIHKASRDELKILAPALLVSISLIMFAGMSFRKYSGETQFMLAERQQALLRESEARENAENFRKEKSDFFSLVSHDLRTPLMSIVTATELIKLRGVDPKNSELMDILQASCSQMKTLLNSVLTVNSADGSAIPSDNEPFSLPIMLSDLIKTCRMATPSADIQLQAMDGGVFPHMVMGNKTILNQIILNLLSNAAKYAGKKPIIVALAYLQVLSNKTKFRISVIDQGAGMEPELIDRMFSPYERGEASKAQRPEGMGLGLWIADRLIRELDGAIEVESVPGQGSAFHITLAMDKYVPGEAGRTSVPALIPANQNHLRILLADDSASIRIILTAYLKTLGHIPVEAADGVEAIAALTSERFDLAILDLEMPEAGGLELARRIRSDAILGQMPVILMTGTERDKLPNLEGLDIETVLQKPVTLSQLRDAINSARVSRQNGSNGSVGTVNIPA